MKSHRVLLACLILIAATLIVYAPLRHFGFVSWDDPDYVTKNVPVTRGLTWQGVGWAFTSGHAAIVAEPQGQAYYIGEWPADYSRQMENLWTRYTVATGAAKGAWIGAGFKSVSKAQSLDSGNKFEFDPSYFELNSAYGYDRIWDHRKMSVVINWTNMLNKLVLPAEQMRPLGARAICTLTCSF